MLGCGPVRGPRLSHQTSAAASGRRILPMRNIPCCCGRPAEPDRPVKWIATRSETFLSDHQARDHVATATLALDGEGRFLALQVDSIANLGAYMAGGVRRGADQSVCASAGHGVRTSGDRAACPGGSDQHHADRRDARPGLWRGGQHHGTPDRRGSEGNVASIVSTFGGVISSARRR